jgi:hypothetical protein
VDGVEVEACGVGEVPVEVATSAACGPTTHR